MDYNYLPTETNPYGTQPRDVFICASGANSIKIRQIAAWLEIHEGLSCWFCERNMPPNCANETELTLQMIKQASVFLLVSSAGAKFNHNVQVAISHAMAHEISRFEFKLDNQPVYELISQASHTGVYQRPDANWELAVLSLGRQIKKLATSAWEEGAHEITETHSRRPNVLYIFILLIFVFGGVLTYSSFLMGRENPPPPVYAEVEDGSFIVPLSERAHEGDRDAQYEYGSIKMILQSFEEATYWFTQAAAQDHVSAQMALAHNYRHGIGIERDPNLAWYWDARAGAVYGIPEWQLQLSLQYRLGHMIPQDLEMSLYWHMRAAEGGFVPAQTWLGHMYLHGDGVAQSNAQAAHWFGQAAWQGDPFAQFTLGGMYFYGQGVAQSHEQAVHWFRQAAEQDHDFFQGDHISMQGISGARVSLGWMYEHDENLEQAAYWYKSAAELGHPVGQNNFGFMLQNGYGVEQDYEQALYWFRKSADQRYTRAAANLGLMYELGTGVEQNDEQAIFWYRYSMYDALTFGDALWAVWADVNVFEPEWVRGRLQRLLEQVES